MIASHDSSTGARAPGRVYRYVPPRQAIARAVTYIGDVLLEFTLTFTGSLIVLTAAAESATITEEKATLQLAGDTLHRIADGLYVSAVKADRPAIESAGGHRFTHASSTSPGPRKRRFTGSCAIELPGGASGPAVTGTLGYVLDVSAAAPSDPPPPAASSALPDEPYWTEHHDRTLASIGAIVLAPVPVAADRAARLYAT